MDADARSIKIHTEAEFESMRRAGQLAAKTLDYITEFVVPGVTTEKLDQLCAEFVSDHGAVSAPLNYRGYPKSVCISVNHVVCHGIPGDKVLGEGDDHTDEGENNNYHDKAGKLRYIYGSNMPSAAQRDR